MRCGDWQAACRWRRMPCWSPRLCPALQCPALHCPALRCLRCPYPALPRLLGGLLQFYGACLEPGSLMIVTELMKGERCQVFRAGRGGAGQDQSSGKLRRPSRLLGMRLLLHLWGGKLGS